MINLYLGWLKNFVGICATTLKSIGRHPGLEGVRVTVFTAVHLEEGFITIKLQCTSP